MRWLYGTKKGVQLIQYLYYTSIAIIYLGIGLFFIDVPFFYIFLFIGFILRSILKLINVFEIIPPEIDWTLIYPELALGRNDETENS